MRGRWSRRVVNGVLLLVVMTTSARAGELVAISGVEPLKSQVNASKDSVRILFLGSPT
ncbi:MAG: hypothetical protein U0166_01100 [Acidobacteriota bacterium]